MTRTAQRLNRILSMLPWVIANPGTAVDEVCDRFGYSRRDLIADLDLVFVCGLPGYGPGDLMVAYVEDDEVIVDMADYFARPLRLTPAEGLGLLAAGLALISSGQAPPALERAVEKLSTALTPEGGEVLAVDVSGEPELVGLLRTAAAGGRVVDIVYSSLGKGETKARSVEPWSVASALGNWYLSAYCRTAGGERIFRVDRIRRAEVTDEAFVPPEDPPPVEVRYLPGEDDVRATIRLTNRARWVAEYYPIEVVEDLESSLVIRFSASDVAVIARLLLRLGSEAALVEGPGVAEALADLRSRILTRYAPA
ncbi:MAG: WYL domain-containing protein [Acidimicrobiia bacterium]|nr:WYL domain-containing protein [Acidimicrobiia bacterium]